MFCISYMFFCCFEDIKCRCLTFLMFVVQFYVGDVRTLFRMLLRISHDVFTAACVLFDE
jgi:hypothetical protein